MKISKSKLRQIIKEELTQVLLEYIDPIKEEKDLQVKLRAALGLIPKRFPRDQFAPVHEILMRHSEIESAGGQKSLDHHEPSEHRVPSVMMAELQEKLNIDERYVWALLTTRDLYVQYLLFWDQSKAQR